MANKCVANTWFEKMEHRKITCTMGGNETEIDFVLVGKKRATEYDMGKTSGRTY